MSLQALGYALKADLPAVTRLVLIYLADEADEYHVTVPWIPRLAARVDLSIDDLRPCLEDLLEREILIPSRQHTFDFIEDAEGFEIQLDRIPLFSYERSPHARAFEPVPSVEPGSAGSGSPE